VQPAVPVLWLAPEQDTAKHQNIRHIINTSTHNNDNINALMLTALKGHEVSNPTHTGYHVHTMQHIKGH